jgi:hypothetical protein
MVDVFGGGGGQCMQHVEQDGSSLDRQAFAQMLYLLCET